MKIHQIKKKKNYKNKLTLVYYLLTENFKEQHKKLVTIILEIAPADKIYFLGSTLVNRRTESIFMTDASSCHYVGHYYVLVLAKSDHNLNTIRDKIENTCRHFIPVTAIVLHTKRFYEWLISGHRFANTVCRIAVLLHGEDERKNVPHEMPDTELIKAENESIYNEGLTKVTEFMAGADLYRIREQNKMAAFMLHQAAEHTLHTILKIMTGLYINTHNIDRLIRYCTMVSYLLPDIFPRNNDKNEHLFQLLNKAYVGTRYKNDYSISSGDLLTIIERVGKLKDVMQHLCKAG